MIFVDRGKQGVCYTALQVNDTWVVRENGRHLAECPDEAAARAIAQALTVQRVMLSMHVLPIEPSPAPELN